MSGPYALVSQRAKRKNTPLLKEQKKIGWFTRWFDRMCRESWQRAQEEREINDAPVPTPIYDHHSIDAEGMNIRIFGATGGTIVEFRRYDRIKDRHDTKMYVISGEQNFSEELAKVVSLEMIR